MVAVITYNGNVEIHELPEFTLSSPLEVCVGCFQDRSTAEKFAQCRFPNRPLTYLTEHDQPIRHW